MCKTALLSKFYVEKLKFINRTLHTFLCFPYFGKWATTTEWKVSIKKLVFALPPLSFFLCYFPSLNSGYQFQKCIKKTSFFWFIKEELFLLLNTKTEQNFYQEEVLHTQLAPNILSYRLLYLSISNWEFYTCCRHHIL